MQGASSGQSARKVGLDTKNFRLLDDKAASRRSGDRADRLEAAGRRSLSPSVSQRQAVPLPGVPQLARKRPHSTSSASLPSQPDERGGSLGSQLWLAEGGTHPVHEEEDARDLALKSILDAPHGVPTMQKDSSLSIFACGQTVQLNIQGGLYLGDVHSQLQAALHLEGRIFQFFSSNGEVISTDEEVRDAVNRGETPLTACIVEVPVAQFENPREELMQMQWKLMREQFSVTSERVTEVSDQVADLVERLEVLRSEQKASVERLRNEFLSVAEGVRENSKCDLMQLAERVNAVSQLLAKERNQHKVATQGVEKQIQNVRDSFDNERSWLRQEILRATNSLLQDTRCLLEAESHARQALEDRHVFDMKKLSERVEELSWTQAKDAQERGQAFKKAALEVEQTLQATKQLTSARAEIEAYVSNSAIRQQELEDRCNTIEAKMLDRQLAAFDQLGENWCNTETDKAVEEKSVQEVSKLPMSAEREGTDNNDDLSRRVAALERVAKKLEGGEGRWDPGLEDRIAPMDKIDNQIADVETKLRQNMEPAEAPPSFISPSRTAIRVISPSAQNRVIQVGQSVSMMRTSGASVSTPGCSYVSLTPTTMTPSQTPKQVGREMREVSVDQPFYYAEWRRASADSVGRAATPLGGTSSVPSLSGSTQAPVPGSPPPKANSARMTQPSSTYPSYIAPAMAVGSIKTG